MTNQFNYPFWNLLSLDAGSGTAIHEQIFLQIRAAVAEGVIPGGARLPPTRHLATELSVSRSTIILAYDRLIAEGYAAGRAGAGTFIAERLPEALHERGLPPGQTPAPPTPDTPRIARRGAALAARNLPNERTAQFDLSPNLPALSELPFAQFGRASAKYWRSPPWGELGYTDQLGVPALRHQIARYLGEMHGFACDPGQIAVVDSTTQGFLLIAHVLLDPGDTVLVEDPAYPTRLAALEAAGAKILPEEVDEQGLDPARFGPAARTARMAVVSPTNQFPFGCTMPVARRRALLDWARDNRSWIVEYDYNNGFRFDGQPLPAIAALDGHRRVIYIGNFNKVLSPALGIAYLVLPPDLIDAVTRARLVFSSQVAPPLQRMVADFMERGELSAHIRRMRGLYGERAAILSASLRDELGGILDLTAPEAGLHLTGHARVPLDDRAIAAAVRRRQIDVPALSAYRIGAREVSGFIFGFGNTPAERIGRCVATFARLLRDSLSARP